MAIDLYARLGPDGIARLVDRLYHWMTVLPEAHASHLLHRADLSEVSRRLTAFLSGWLGGPDQYRAAYGEPMMRRRHFAFPIGPAERDAWMAALSRALDEVTAADPELHAALHAVVVPFVQGVVAHGNTYSSVSSPSASSTGGLASTERM